MKLRSPFALFLSLLVVLVPFGVASAQNADFPGVQKAMPAEVFEQAGLSKLSPAERARLDEFIRSYVAASNEKAATVAIDQAVKQEKVKRTEPEVVQSNIVGRFSGYNGRSKFVLANGQVWRQSQQVSRSFPPVDSPAVFLTRGKWGWRMYIVGGGDLRVSRAN
ncbi:MAG: hypothetical protein ABIR71_12070 [Chthoniobacterales bacterium]